MSKFLKSSVRRMATLLAVCGSCGKPIDANGHCGCS